MSERSSSIAIGVAGSDLSTLLVELREYETARYGPLPSFEHRGERVFVIEFHDPSEGATEDYEPLVEGVLLVRGMHEAIRRFSEVTGGVFVEPSAFDGSPERTP